MAGRGLLAAAALAGLAGLGAAAVPAAASSLTAPGIHAVRPAHGAAGTKVTITGSGFTGVTAVRFAGVAAAFKVRSSKITARVPDMPSAAGRITVSTRAGTATSRSRFTVTPRVVLSPTTAPPGSVVTVSGTGFGTLEGTDIFMGTADEALAGTSTAGSFGPIRVTIPATAVPGTAWISAEGRHTRLFTQAAFTVNTNWAQFRFSATRTGTNPFENVLSTSSVTRLSQDWTFTTGSPVGSSPAVANGMVYIGSDNHNVYALNAATGARRWTFTTGSAVDSSPAVANGVVYIGSDDHNVYAIKAATGARLWRFRTGRILDFSAPAVANGIVYIAAFDNNVYALNAATGARLWTFTSTGLFDATPAVANGVVYIASDDNNVYALNAATGATVWNSTIGASTGSSPVVASGVVYVGADDGNVYALNAATGAQLWTFTTGNVVRSSPAVANGMVYIGSEDGNMYAFGLPGGTATPARPNRNSLHPDYNLPSSANAPAWQGPARADRARPGRASRRNADLHADTAAKALSAALDRMICARPGHNPISKATAPTRQGRAARRRQMGKIAARSSHRLPCHTELADPQ